jgi:general secretion pathway protein L
MLAEFATWWLERMGELAASARRGATLPDTLLLRPSAGGTAFEALRRRRGRCQTLGHFDLDSDVQRLRAIRRRGETLTLASDARLLRRVVGLQLAAERGLATLLHYEMDRLTPFTVGDIYWDWRLMRRDRASGTLDAELVLLPRAAIAPLLETLATAELRPAAVEATLPDGSVRGLPLDPPDPAVAMRARRRQGAALALCAALGVACIAAPPIRHALALASLETEIAALRPEVAQAQALQRRIADEAAGASAIGAGRAHAADVLTALAALTDALPDDTYLTQLSLHQGRLTMEGQTTAAATRLIAAVAAEPRLRDPAFTAPVVRGDAGNEIFALQAELAR